MPSNIVVTDHATLAQNFAENSKELFCSTAFQAGALGTGIASLYFAPLTAGASIPIAALLTSLATCPNDVDQEFITGGNPPFNGGQCPTVYSVICDRDVFGNGSIGQVNIGTVLGPIYGLVSNINPNTGNIEYNIEATDSNGNRAIIPPIPRFNTGPQGSASIASLTRQDGQPDNCGNPPGNPPPVYVPAPDGEDVINDNRVIKNDNKRLIIPVNFNIGTVAGVVNMPFSNPQIKTHIPLTVNFRIGGVDFGVNLTDDPPTLLPPDGQSRDDALKKILEDIKDIEDCVCKPKIELDMLNLPLVQEVGEECNDISINLLAARGTYPVNIEQQFEQSRVLAEKGCDEPPPKDPRTIILSGTATGTQQIFTTGMLDSAIKVVEFEVTSFGPDTRLFIGGNNNENQGRFGVLSPGYFDDGGQFFAMPGLAQYYEKNLIVIPPEIEGSLGLRVSVPIATTFNLWDTGLRF